VQPDLFSPAAALPQGFRYQAEFLNADEEARLLGALATQPFEQAQYRQWRARRRIVSYGGRYDFSRHSLHDAPPIPPFLRPLQERIAAWAGVEPSRIHHATIAEYRPGSQLGWHRDVPDFEEVMGVSLLSCARMRLRPYPPEAGQRSVYAIELTPRSAYLMRGPARWAWQHAISPTKALRYSITFRTLRAHGSKSRISLAVI
jgi:alkylated DNA repair dioxygenase AlkB